MSSLPNHRRRIFRVCSSIWVRKSDHHRTCKDSARNQSRNGYWDGRNTDPSILSTGTSPNRRCRIHGGHQGHSSYRCCLGRLYLLGCAICAESTTQCRGIEICGRSRIDTAWKMYTKICGKYFPHNTYHLDSMLTYRFSSIALI